MEVKNKPQQFRYTEQAKIKLLKWSEANNLKIVHIDFIVPFVRTDHSLVVFLFFDTNNTLQQNKKTGFIREIDSKFMNILEDINYPTEYLKEVTIEHDSKENIDENYRGKYFYRLR